MFIPVLIQLWLLKEMGRFNTAVVIHRQVEETGEERGEETRKETGEDVRRRET